jgi:hypothetical protein
MSYWKHIKMAFDQTSIYDGAATFHREFTQLPEYIGDLLAAHWMLSEISNGGFHQFFANPTGVLAPEAAQGFTRMGHLEVGELIRRAMAHFGDVYPCEQDDRELFLKSHGPELFEPLEQRLYEIGSPSLDKIYDAMDLYARHNSTSPATQQ